MTPTISKELKTFFITDTIGFNLVAFLINMPSLGLTNTPSNDELLLRENLTMANAVAQEINSTSYQRAIITFDPADIVYSSGEATINVAAQFTPSIGNPIGPFTHIVWARGANLIGANSSNGNNRGDTSGTIYKVEPVIGAPLTITHPVVFTSNTDITITV